MHLSNIKGLIIFVYGKLCSFIIIIAFIACEMPLNNIVIYTATAVYAISEVVLLTQTKFSNWRDD